MISALLAIVLAPATVKVAFVLKSPDLSSETTVYITGSAPQLGNWNPGAVKMESKGNHVWRKEVELYAPINLEYKYTLGSWEREGANANGSPLMNFARKIEKDVTIEDAIAFWTKPGPKAPPSGQITGTVRYHRGLKGAGIADRDVVVWLPPSYATNRKERYPVLYMHDGQNVFDPKTSAFGVDWQIDETVTRLIKDKAIAPLIVVGVYNSSDRTSEYSQTPKGAAYRKFLIETVKPLIDKSYRTKSDRANTFTGGSSMGGLVSFILAWERSDVFSKAICMSPAFQSPKGFKPGFDYVKVVLDAKGKKPSFFYIDNGAVGVDADLQPGVDAMLAALKTRGYQRGKDFAFVLDNQAPHNEADWAKRMPNALKLLLNRKRP